MPSLNAPNAISKVVLAAVKLALGTNIPPPSALVPANIADAYTGFTEGGEPHPMSNEWFVGIHKDPSSLSQVPPGGRATYVDEVFTQLITVSMRVTRYASSRVAKDGYPVLENHIRTIAAYFANNPYTIMNLINDEMDLTATNGFIEPFMPANPSPQVQKRGKSWFKSASKTSTQGTLAVSATLRLEGLRRVQAVGGIN